MHYGSYKYSDKLSVNLQNYWKITKPYGRSFAVMMAVSALFSTFVTYKEGTSFYKMQLKLLEDEQKAEELINKKIDWSGGVYER